MNLNDSINVLQEGRTSQRGLNRSTLYKGFSSNLATPNRLSQSILLNDSVSYIPHDVYMAERTIGMDTLIPVNNTYVKLDPSVVKQKADALYDHFLSHVQGRSSSTEIFETVRDLIQACSDTYDDILRNGGRLNERNIFDGFGWLNQERNTWKLVLCLYGDRVLGQRNTDADSELNELWLYSSEKEIIQKLYEHHQNLREYQLIVDWLEQCASEQHIDKYRHFTDETISWENTLHQLQNVDTTAFGRGNKIVDKLDPDAPYRENKPLHDLDMEDEQRISKEVRWNVFNDDFNAQSFPTKSLYFSQILYEIRQGHLDEASSLCERVGQFWRAAILEGWRLYHDPNYKNTIATSQKVTYLNLHFLLI